MIVLIYIGNRGTVMIKRPRTQSLLISQPSNISADDSNEGYLLQIFNFSTKLSIQKAHL